MPQSKAPSFIHEEREIFIYVNLPFFILPKIKKGCKRIRDWSEPSAWKSETGSNSWIKISDLKDPKIERDGETKHPQKFAWSGAFISYFIYESPPAPPQRPKCARVIWFVHNV